MAETQDDRESDASNAPQVSLVIPVYNEEHNVSILAAEITAAMAPSGWTWEVLWIDDGSTDGSADAVRAVAAGDPRQRLVRLLRNCGQSAAFDAGIRRARGALLVTLDGDLQNDPADIPHLLAHLDGADVVNGVRRQRQDSWLRRVSSRLANGVRNRLTGESVTDVGCSLRACRTELARQVPMFTGMHRFLPTLLRLAGARLVEVPVHHRPRLYGKPKYNIRNRLFRALVDLWAVRWMQRRWIERDLAMEVDLRPAGLDGEETDPWIPRPSGSSSASSARASSSAASSSSGSSPSGGEKALCPEPSGSSVSGEA